MNRALWTSLAGIGAAQALKIPMKIRESGRFQWNDLIGTGGMPSSHAAGVASLATYIGMKKGFTSISFALASVLSLVVMYDAMGIRRHAGLIATEVNDLGDTVLKLSEQSELDDEDSPVVSVKPKKELEERLGHLPQEVLGGALLGVLVGCISYAGEVQAAREERVEAWSGLIRKSLAGLL